MDTLLTFFLNRSLKTVFFKIRQSLPFLYINLNWRAKFQIYRLRICDSDWLNCIHFSGYKYKIKLVSILRKREDRALISISTILKFSAQSSKLLYCGYLLVCRSNLYSISSMVSRTCSQLDYLKRALIRGGITNMKMRKSLVFKDPQNKSAYSGY